MAKDKWMLDPEEAKTQEAENKIKNEGEVCPKMNKSIGGRCYVCDALGKVFQTHKKGDPMWNLAVRKAAKYNWFLNAVFEDNPEKVVIVMLGKQAGDTIIEQLKKGKWLDIAHPKKGKGRCIEITKTADGDYNKYPVSPDLEKADWDIPDSVLENLPNLDQSNLIKMLKEGETEFFKISSLKPDETISFRICPPWPTGVMGDDNKRPMTAIWRHWGVSKAEIDGEEELDMTLTNKTGKEDSDDEGSAPWEDSGEEEKAAKKEEKPKEEPKEEPPAKEDSGKKSCFGDKRFWDEDDDECQSCADFKKCGRAAQNS